MISSALFISLILAGSASAPLDAKDPLYIRYNIAEPNMNGVPLLETFIVEESRHSILMGDFGIVYEPCPDGWKCIPMERFQFAVPAKCSKAETSNSWIFKDRKFTLVDVLTSLPYEKGRKIYVIDIADTDGSRYGSATWSKERGLESFAYVNHEEPVPRLRSYHLASDRGTAFGGCIPTPAS